MNMCAAYFVRYIDIESTISDTNIQKALNARIRHEIFIPVAMKKTKT